MSHLLGGHLSIALVALLAGAATGQDAIRVSDSTEGCFHSGVHSYEWKARGDHYALGERTITREAVEEIRRLLLSSRGEPDDLLASVGITPASIASHRDQILRSAAPEMWKDPSGAPPVLTPELEHLLTFEYLSPHILRELKSENWGSTTSFEFGVVLPGRPLVTVSSDGLVPWMLPWTISHGEETWSVADIEVSKALLKLADPNGVCAKLMDGTSYWSEGFWTDRSLWDRLVGTKVNRALSMQECRSLPGFSRFSERFEIEDVSSGSIGLQPHALFCEITARTPKLIDSARWWNLIKDDEFASDWEEFLRVYDAANAAVEREGWMRKWKLVGKNRTIGLNAVGARGYSENKLDFFVLPAWKDAGFAGDPQFELSLRRDGEWCGTVYLSSTERGALIGTAKPADGELGKHWFDSLDFSFHPNAEAPTYGRVDEAGEVEQRVWRKK